MKTNISLGCKKSPFFATVKMVLGQLPPNSSPNPKAIANISPNQGGGGDFFRGNSPDTGKNKRNEKTKRNKK